MRFTAVDLFCGAGGFSLGLQKAEIEVVGAADCWDTAIRTYSSNFEHPIIQANLSKVSAADLRDQFKFSGPVDLVVGGPPCQGFSVQRIGADADNRNNLVLDFARLTLDFAPRAFIMENVPGLLGVRGRQLVTEFERMLVRGGYCVAIARINAADYGVPQIRKRVFFCGWRLSDGAPFAFPAPFLNESQYISVIDAIGDLQSPPDDFTPAIGDPLHRKMRLSPKNIERIRAVPPGGGMAHLPAELRVNCHRAGADRIGHRYVYGRLDQSRAASTITARFDSFTRGRFGHPTEDRNITLREGARLQTFPDQFRFAGSQEDIAAQIGNAVPPELAFIIASAFVRAAERGSATLESLGSSVTRLQQLTPQLPFD